jgi:hypothetical protein
MEPFPDHLVAKEHLLMVLLAATVQVEYLCLAVLEIQEQHFPSQVQTQSLVLVVVAVAIHPLVDWVALEREMVALAMLQVVLAPPIVALAVAAVAQAELLVVPVVLA